jgi:hypothetical protein
VELPGGRFEACPIREDGKLVRWEVWERLKVPRFIPTMNKPLQDPGRISREPKGFGRLMRQSKNMLIVKIKHVDLWDSALRERAWPKR